MAIDATTIDSAAAAAGAVPRTVPRERPSSPAASPIINDGHNGRGVEIQSDMSFGDFLDVLNPLQHIPIVGTIYREITGDTIKPAAKVMGGILFGGVVGGMASIANAVVEEAQGKDFGDQIMAALGFGGGDHRAPGAATEVAANPEDAAAGIASATAAQGVSQAASQAAPTQVAAADRPVRLTASAAPPMGAASAAALGLSAQAGAQAAAAQRLSGGSPRDALAAGTSSAGTSLAGTSPGAPAAPSRMPPRDTPLANSMLAKHAAPRFAAPMPGATMAGAQAAKAPGIAKDGARNGAGDADSSAAANTPRLEVQDGASPNAMTPVSPDMLSETMMRNLAKYEQSRKAAAPSAAPSLRVSS